MSNVPADLQAFVQSKLATGQFSSVDDVAFAAMRAVRDNEQQLAEWKVIVDEGIRDIEENGEVDLDAESIRAQLRAEFGHLQS